MEGAGSGCWWSLRGSSNFSLSLRCVVEDVQAAPAGQDDVCHKLSAVGADVTQSAAMSVQMREFLLH